jgi:hypothetical protein
LIFKNLNQGLFRGFFQGFAISAFIKKRGTKKNKEIDSKFRHNCSPKLPQLQAQQLKPPPPAPIRPSSASTPVRVPVPPSQK